MAQKWNLGKEEMQFTKLSDICYIDLLQFSPTTEKHFSSPCIPAVGPAALLTGCAFPLGHGEMTLHVVCGAAFLSVQNPQEQKPSD